MFWIGKRVLLIRAEFCLSGRLAEQKAPKGLPHSFHKLSDDKITSLEMLSTKLAEPPATALVRFQGTCTGDRNAWTKKIGCHAIEPTR